MGIYDLLQYQTLPSHSGSTSVVLQLFVDDIRPPPTSSSSTLLPSIASSESPSTARARRRGASSWTGSTTSFMNADGVVARTWRDARVDEAVGEAAFGGVVFFGLMKTISSFCFTASNSEATNFCGAQKRNFCAETSKVFSWWNRYAENEALEGNTRGSFNVNSS